MIPFEILDNKQLLLKLSLVADRVFYLDNNLEGTTIKIKPTFSNLNLIRNLKLNIYMLKIYLQINFKK